MATLQVVLGTGPLGMAVARALLQKGYSVRMINTSGKASVPAGVDVRAANAYDSAQIADLTKGAEAVYFCMQPPYNEWPQKFPPLQAAVLEGVSRSGTRLVIAENTYMYGPSTEPYTEQTPYRATSSRGKTRGAMSLQALEAHQNGLVPVVIGRASDFFGPGVLNSALGASAIVPALKGKTAQLFGRLDLPHTFSYINDMGRALVLLGESPEAFGQVWHLPNDQPTITQREVMELVFAETGKPARMYGVRDWMLRLLSPFWSVAREGREMLYQFEQPFVVDSSQFDKAFQLKPTPLPQAIYETVEWFRTYQPRS